MNNYVCTFASEIGILLESLVRVHGTFLDVKNSTCMLLTSFTFTHNAIELYILIQCKGMSFQYHLKDVLVKCEKSPRVFRPNLPVLCVERITTKHYSKENFIV